MRDELKAQRHKTVHITTIWRLLKRLGLGLKQVRMSLIHLCTDPLMLAQLSQLAAERDPERRAIFRYIIGLESPDWLVCLDETHVDTRTTYRVNGWGKRGQRVRVSHNWVRGKRYAQVPLVLAPTQRFLGGPFFPQSLATASSMCSRARMHLTAMHSLSISRTFSA